MTATGLSPDQVRDEMTIPIVVALSDHWTVCPPPAVSLNVVATFLRSMGGQKTNRKEILGADGKPAAVKPPSLVGDLVGMGGVGFVGGKLAAPLDPAGLMKGAQG